LIEDILIAEIFQRDGFDIILNKLKKNLIVYVIDEGNA